MSHIWVPKLKILEPKSALPLGMGVAGEYRLQVYRPDGRQRLDTGFFPNLITNAGLDMIGSGASYGYCSVGSGSTAPSNSDTALVSRIATTSTTQSSSSGDVGMRGDAAWYYQNTNTYRFGAGAAAGNLSEVGMTVGSSPYTCFSRALILDGVGSPTTITVLSDEYLDVSYRRRIYPASVSDGSGSFTVTGVGSISYTSRPALNGSTSWQTYATFVVNSTSRIRCYSGSIGAITSLPSGLIGDVSPTWSTYTSEDYYRDASSTFGLATANHVSGINAIDVSAGSSSNDNAAPRYQFGLATPIMKTSSHVLTLNARVAWARKAI